MSASACALGLERCGITFARLLSDSVFGMHTCKHTCIHAYIHIFYWRVYIHRYCGIHRHQLATGRSSRLRNAGQTVHKIWSAGRSTWSVQSGDNRGCIHGVLDYYFSIPLTASLLFSPEPTLTLRLLGEWIAIRLLPISYQIKETTMLQE